MGSIAQNISEVKNVLESEDVFSTINCLKKLGVQIKSKSNGSYLIYGKGLGSHFAKKNLSLNFGNSGTLARVPDIEKTPSVIIIFPASGSAFSSNFRS